MGAYTNRDLDTTLTESQAKAVERVNPALRQSVLAQRVRQLELGKIELEKLSGKVGVVNVYALSGAAANTYTVTITDNTYSPALVDVYEIRSTGTEVLSDDSVGVELGTVDQTLTRLAAAINKDSTTNEHPNLLKTDGETPAIANGKLRLKAVADLANDRLYVYRVDVDGNPELGANLDIAFAEVGANSSWQRSTWTENPVVEEFASNIASLAIPVTTALLAATPIRVFVNFEPKGAVVQARSSASAVKSTTTTVSWDAVGDGYVVSMDGAGLANGDTLSVILFGA